ncbi:hypothetical protein T552_02859 [Pneumocystis carinii B80]|uniref:Cep57 centrosome microtubule-binding domain-containing protein n=1 Tax=Pneumocystis carinii (strain B80) TaxID=1408658 RepID=A0A0W4ZDB4_PNEC8|nr:hypothetical protein T552_02859 [Pneumocystis carinii B80]KTW26377.1 hypothetical protein T552_02859 [Pneumocystis carinii B80]
MPTFEVSLDPDELSISTDVRERDRIRLEQELEKELNGFSFTRSSSREPSSDTVRPNQIEANQTFFADSLDTKSLNKHFQDFSMGASGSLDSNSIERGVGLQLGTSNLKNEFSKTYTGSTKSFDRPVALDNFMAAMKSPLESTTSDYADVAAKIKHMYSPFNKVTEDMDFTFSYDKNYSKQEKPSPEMMSKTKLTYALKKTELSNIPIVERDRNIMTPPAFTKTKSPVFQRFRRASIVNNENIYSEPRLNKSFRKGENNGEKKLSNLNHNMKPIPRSFKTASGLMRELGLDDHQENMRTDVPLNTEMTQSFRLPDITGISSLVCDDVYPIVNKIEVITKDNYKDLESIPISSNDKAILLAIRELQSNINELEARESASKKRIQNLEKELENAKQLYHVEQKRTTFVEQNQEVNNDKNAITHQSSETHDREKLSYTMERMRLKNDISSLKAQVESLERELSISKSKIDDIREKKNEVSKKLAEALSKIDHLKLENKKLIGEIEDLRKTHKIKTASENVKKKKASEFCLKSPLEEKNGSTKVLLQSDSNETDDEISKEHESCSTETDEEEIDELPKSLHKTKKSQSSKALRTTKNNHSIPIVSSKSSKKKNKQESKKSSKKLKSNSQNPSKKRQIHPDIIEETDSTDDTSEYDYSREYSSNDDDLLNQEPPWIHVENKLKTKLSKSRQIYEDEFKGNARSKAYVDVNAQKIIEELDCHNPVSCSVCTRRRQKGILSEKNKDLLSYSAKSKQLDNIFEEENTIRPSMSPRNALSMVIIQLEDEFKHLKLKYQEFIQSYEKVDPSVGKRKRKVLAGKLKNIIEELEAKADQIYALYDVVELAKEGDDILKKVLRSSRTSV